MIEVNNINWYFVIAAELLVVISLFVMILNATKK